MVANLFAGVVPITVSGKIEAIQTPQRCELSTDRIKLTWEYSDDRWRHVLSLLRGDAWEPLLTSVEGTAADDFPASPVFQELLLEQKQSDLCEVQLFGRSGKILFAAAVTLDATKQIVEFDISARLRSGVTYERLSSTYAVPEWQQQDQQAQITTGSGAPLLVDPISPEAEPTCKITKNQPGQLQIDCTTEQSAGSSPSGTTLRWQYRILTG